MRYTNRRLLYFTYTGMAVTLGGCHFRGFFSTKLLNEYTCAVDTVSRIHCFCQYGCFCLDNVDEDLLRKLTTEFSADF